MFSKITALIFFAAGISQAAAQGAGVYTIVNEATATSLRSYQVGENIFVRSTREDPGPFGQWRIAPNSEGITSVTNVGLRANASAERLGDGVITDQIGSPWFFSPAEGGTYLIQVPYTDLVWNAEDPDTLYSPVVLRLQNGEASERWSLEAVV